jgi:hypothetical protein
MSAWSFAQPLPGRAPKLLARSQPRRLSTRTLHRAAPDSSVCQAGGGAAGEPGRPSSESGCSAPSARLRCSSSAGLGSGLVPQLRAVGTRVIDWQANPSSDRVAE